MTSAPTSDSIELRRDITSNWFHAKQRANRNVADACNIRDDARRDKCRGSLLDFFTEYTPDRFPLEMGDRHLSFIADVEVVILKGGRVVTAMPRGSGKTSILEAALVWATLYGHRQFPIIVSATAELFRDSMDSIKSILRFNELLAEDFPEVIGPIREIDDKSIRCKGQHFDEENTFIGWDANSIRFPNTPKTRERGNSGAVLGGGGLTGALRGKKAVLASGEVVRPDCLLFDDVQTRESAESLSQTRTRMKLIHDCLAMEGPSGEEMSALMGCTVIAEDDVSSRLLSDQRPEWRAHRVKTLENFPDDMDLWNEYREIQRRELLDEMDEGSAKAFYLENREAMDAGALHYWPARFRKSRISAIQDAMDWFFEDEPSFYSERQNEPLQDALEGQLEDLKPLTLTRRIREVERFIVPQECTTLTAYVDVQGEVLFYAIVGWTENFGGHVVDYGTWPDLKMEYFTLLDLPRSGRTLSRTYPKHDEQGRIAQGVIDCLQNRINREFKREGGTTLSPSIVLVDSGWQPDAVERGVRDSGMSVAYPAKGFGITATRAPMAQWPKKPGEKRGMYWVQRPVRGGSKPLAEIDVNFWKTEIHDALICPETNQTALTFFKANPSRHQMIADHCCAERGVKATALGRTVVEWLLRRIGQDNHWWDCLVGAAAAASMAGVVKPGGQRRRKVKIRMSSGRMQKSRSGK